MQLDLIKPINRGADLVSACFAVLLLFCRDETTIKMAPDFTSSVDQSALLVHW